ncbi:MAG: hypothetical protein ACOYN3_01570 [Acidimicrobiia bacterium]
MQAIAGGHAPWLTDALGRGARPISPNFRDFPAGISNPADISYMDLVTFTTILGALEADDLEMVASGLDAGSVGDEVDAWHAMIAIDNHLRRTQCSRQAAHAAYQASQAVLLVAGRAGYELPHAVPTKVARSAADIARAITAGDACSSELAFLLHAWTPVLRRTARVA